MRPRPVAQYTAVSHNDSIFSGIPNSLPEIIKSQRIQDKASGVGFEWRKTEHVWDKVKEEEKELINAINLKNKISIVLRKNS